MCSLLHFSYPLQPALEKDKWLGVRLKLLLKYKTQLASYQHVKWLFIFDYFLMKTVCISRELSFIAPTSGTQTDEHAIYSVCSEKLSLPQHFSSQIRAAVCAAL